MERLLIVDVGQVGRHPWRGTFPDGRRFAGAVFLRDATGQWECVRAAPCLRWMTVSPFSNIERFLKGEARDKGWRYAWARRFEL
jgi:hypothetical protein